MEVPRHIAIIMDGNGRWAGARGLPRVAGHRAGAMAIGPVLEHAAMLGVEVLTLYSFSSENWSRPTEEIDALMRLCCEKLAEELPELIRKGVRLKRIGRDVGLPEDVVQAFDRAEAATAGGKRITMVLALNYGSRGEIVDATKAVARRVADGSLGIDEITESELAGELYTAGLPDPDLLIRTAGQMRLSNYLLWQLSYAEILFTQTLWPDFGPAQLDESVLEFGRRRRTFGGLGMGCPPAEPIDRKT